MRPHLLLPWLLLVGCATEAAPLAADLPEGAVVPAGKADGPADVVYTSATEVRRLVYREDEAERSGEELAYVFGERVSPDSTAGEPWTYARTMSALGYYGPIGPYGPLGILGPTGGNPWNPDLYVTGSFAWSDHAEELAADGGALSADGPLGSQGPLDTDRWQDEGDLADGAFVPHLRPGGIFAVLGPVGVSGALGPLGPLGPIGAHGYLRDDDGDYVPEDGSDCHDAPDGFRAPPCRVIEVEWEPGGELRRYELVELYDEERAMAMEDNDTSFVVIGRADEGETDEYAFSSAEGQWVTIVALPETAKYPFVQAMSVLGAASGVGYREPSSAWLPHLLTGIPVFQVYDHRATFDDFDLEVDVEVAGETLGTIGSNSADVVDWVSVKVPAGARLRARVTLYAAWTPSFADSAWGLTFRPAAPTYRLVVVGSTENGQGGTVFSGPYLHSLN